MFTRFMDMHSGGKQKEDFSYCYIEASENEAKVIFYNRFGHNPERVTCTCCGNDYSISEYENLEQATAYERGCNYVDGKYIEEWSGKSYQPYMTLNEYINNNSVHVIYASDIKPSERKGNVPEQGYIWID